MIADQARSWKLGLGDPGADIGPGMPEVVAGDILRRRQTAGCKGHEPETVRGPGLGDVKVFVPLGPISQQWPEIDGPAGKARVRSLRRIDPLKRNMAAKTSLSHDLDSYAGRFTIRVHDSWKPMRKGLELLAGSRGMSQATVKPDSATKPKAIPTPSRWYRRRGECASTPLTHWLIGSIRWNKLWLVAARLIAG